MGWGLWGVWGWGWGGDGGEGVGQMGWSYQWILHIGVGWERGMASKGGYTQRIGCTINRANLLHE